MGRSSYRSLYLLKIRLIFKFHPWKEIVKKEEVALRYHSEEELAAGAGHQSLDSTTEADFSLDTAEGDSHLQETETSVSAV